MALALLLMVVTLAVLGDLAIRRWVCLFGATVSARLSGYATDAESRELSCVDRLLAGTASQTEYTDEMAALAAAGPAAAVDVVALVWCAGRKATAVEELRQLLGRMTVALPELPVGTVRSALALVRAGADVEELIRVLRLTRVQARTIRTVVDV
jgi:hypothetical protein